MTDLCKLAEKYGTDKIHYTPFYSLLLEGRRTTTDRVLEIGIGTPAAMRHVAGYKPGASLRMWEEYFPDAEIYGMDIDPSVMFTEGRIKTFQASQSVPAQYLDFVKQSGPFDLIVDDGSHHVEHQLITVNALMPFLCEGGLYIIEDVNTCDGLTLKLEHPHSDVFVKYKQLAHCVILNA